MRFRDEKTPRLLVSVRNGAEAVLAAQAGVDLIDFKEPSDGALGPVAPQVLQQACRELSQVNPAARITLACGEVIDAANFLPRTASGICWLKLGLARLGQVSDWREQWQHARTRILQAVPGSEPGWMGVAYVDAEAAGAPPVDEIVAAVLAGDCDGVLFDTCSKQSGRLPDFLPFDRLERLADKLKAAGRVVAVAGRLRGEDLPALVQMPVDVVAIRSAACLGNARNQALCQTTLQEFQSQLRQLAAGRV
jgi:uncharacterized protein (UPF0264 family)